MSHTPGPWKVDSYGDITGGPNYLTSVAETYSCKWAHCQATSAHKHSQEAADYCGQMFDEAKANGALIAAAPDLLEACEEVFRNCELFRTADNMAGRLCRIVESAIAKAKGE